MSKFTEVAKMETEKTSTTNGAQAWTTTGDALVDLFGSIGSFRQAKKEDIIAKFEDAFQEDYLLALKSIFYARNIRGGLGERNTFKVLLNYLAQTQPTLVKHNMENIALFGRYDDYYALVDTLCEADMWTYLHSVLQQDIKNMSLGQPISLLAKWLKSEKTSSPESRKLARKTMKAFGMTNQTYRKTLVALRKYLKVVEVNMSGQTWENIQYEAVPSKAMNTYRHAFENRDGARFDAYIESLVKGETKINASTLYPYDIVEKMLYQDDNHPVLEAQWKALPNYVEGENNILCMVDTSGSMYGRPLAAALGLGLYFAERNKGDYHNLFMTFSGYPEFVHIKGATLATKIKNMCKAKWDMNTNFEAAFEKILELSIKNKVPKEQMPKSLVVISDMQFDYALDDSGAWDFYGIMRDRFHAKGYEIPNIIFWNASEADHSTYHARATYSGVQMVSGYSASSFKTILTNIGKTPYEAMLNTLSDPMYDCVTL